MELLEYKIKILESKHFKSKDVKQNDWDILTLKTVLLPISVDL